MRIRTICCLLITLCAAAPSLPRPAGAQDAETRHELRIEAGPLGRALNQLATQSGVQILYEPRLVEGRTARSLVGESSLQEALGVLLRGTDVTFHRVNGNTVVLRRAEATRAEGDATEEEPSGALSGRVTQGGEPVAGATVTATGAGLGEPRRVTTGEDGRYQLNDLPPGTYTLRFELDGLVPVTKEVEVPAEESTTQDIQMSLHEIREDMVVVGSRLGSTPVESALPIKVLDREQIDRSGATSIAQALSLLPEVSISNSGDNPLTNNPLRDIRGSTNSTSVQLRGLPLGTTLVLVNGRRVGGSAINASRGSTSFFDLSNIPLSMVERIEVLPYGASAVYGGDGLAGVVNIVTKRNAQGLDVRLRNGMADGLDETQASMTWGKAWSRGSLTATASYEKSGTLHNTERSLTRDPDFRRFGGEDQRTTTFANPGTVYSLDGCQEQLASQGFCLVPPEERGDLPGLDAPVAGIPAGQDGQGLTPADFAATAGIPNLGSFDSRFFSASETTSVTLQGRYEIGPRLELFGDLLYSKRDVPPREVFVLESSGSIGFTVVPAENPFNPFGVDVGVDFFSQSTGLFQDYQPEFFQPTLGVRGGWGEWTWELAGSLSKDLTDLILPVQLDAAKLDAALASSDPATALNPFRGDGGSFGSQDLIESLFTSQPSDFGSDLWQVNGFVRGPLAKLPAGPIEALLGVEWERQELKYRPRPEDPESTSNVSGSDESRAAFAELRLPLIARSGKQARGELLALTGAFRADESDRFEETGTTETVGLELRPISSLLLRATTSSAFKPLSAFSVFNSTLAQLLTITDPQMGGEVFLVEVLLGGGVTPDLKPETSRSNTVGLVWTPRSLAGLNLSVTAWENRVRNRIVGSIFWQFLVDNEDAFPDRVIRDPETGVVTRVDTRPLNFSLNDVEGVDFGLSWRWSTRYGDFSPSLAATWVAKHENQISEVSPVQDTLAVFSPSGSWSPRWKGTTTLNWALEDQVQATLIGRYVSGYQDAVAFATGPKAGTFQTLGDIWHFDLNVDLSLGRWLTSAASPLSDTRLSIGAVNLFNRLPEFCNACSTRGYDPSQYDIRGRTVYTELKLSF